MTPVWIDIRKTRCGLRLALDYEFCCRERQNVFAICPRQLTLAGCCSRVPLREHHIRRNRCFQSDCNSLPAYAGNSGNLAAIRSVPHRACAQQIRFPVTVLIPTACRIFRTALWAPSHMKQDFRPSSCSQIDELADFRRFVPTGEGSEAFTHARPAGCFGYRRLAPSNFLSPSAQPFELGPGAFPLASGVKQLFAA